MDRELPLTDEKHLRGFLSNQLTHLSDLVLSVVDLIKGRHPGLDNRPSPPNYRQFGFLFALSSSPLRRSILSSLPSDLNSTPSNRSII